jgi:hypothetical protein
MQQSLGNRTSLAPAVIGVLLIAVGAGALALRELGPNFLPSIGVWGWPFFIIVPGVVLLGLALVPTPPRGIGFATAGAIVTTVGALLLYQWRTAHWESWAYAWALIPMSAGLAMAIYGRFARVPDLVKTGIWMAAIAALLFGVGAWFFEGLFAGQDRIVDAGNWWPIAVIAIGAILAVRAFLAPARVDAPAWPPTAPEVSTPPTPGVDRPSAPPEGDRQVTI